MYTPLFVSLTACSGMSPVATSDSETVPPPLTDRIGGEGPEGPAGPPGPQGTHGAPGPTASYHWVDAAGADVTIGWDLTWIDPATGYVWAIDPDTAEFESPVSGVLTTYYLDPNCSGPEYVQVVEPNVPFEYWWGGKYYVRAPNVASLDVCPATKVSLNVCVTNLCIFDDAFLATSSLTDTGLTSPPTSSWIGPLHLEDG